MRAATSTITQKGQVTIPAEMRRQLGLKAHDRVSFELDDGTIVLRPVTSVVARYRGIVQPRQRPEDWNAVRREVERMMAEDVAAEGNESSCPDS